MGNIIKITKRELMGYFTTPVGYVFTVGFLWALWYLVFVEKDFYEIQNATMEPVFAEMPTIFLLFIPAVGMRLWSEERRTGTIELLLTLPISLTQATIGKFIAAWLFIFMSIMCSITFVFTLNHLGDPDNWVIFANYLGITLAAGAFLSIASLTSALTKNQVISLILSLLVSVIFLKIGNPGLLLEIKAKAEMVNLPISPVVDFMSYLSFETHLQNLQKGIVDSRDIIFFMSFIAVAIFFNILLINKQKAK